MSCTGVVVILINELNEEGYKKSEGYDPEWNKEEKDEEEEDL
jgi:hypothetical protein